MGISAQRESNDSKSERNYLRCAARKLLVFSNGCAESERQQQYVRMHRPIELQFRCSKYV